MEVGADCRESVKMIIGNVILYRLPSFIIIKSKTQSVNREEFHYECLYIIFIISLQIPKFYTLLSSSYPLTKVVIFKN